MSARTATATAILLAVAEDDQGGVACLLPVDGVTLLARLVRQLMDVGVQQVMVLTRPQWAAAIAPSADIAVEAHGSVPAMLDRLAQLARATTAELLIADADLLTSDAVVADLLLDSRIRTAVLSASGPPSPLCPPVRVSGTRVVASGSAYHHCERANARLLGLCKVGRADMDGLARVLVDLATLLAAGLPREWSLELERTRAALATSGGPARAERLVAALRDDPLPLVVVGLVRRDVPVTTVDVRELYWGRPRSADAAVTAFEELQRIDEDAVRLAAAVKDVDGFFATFFVSPYSRYIARWAARRGLTPNQVTVVSTGLGLLAAAAFAAGSRTWLVAGAILLQLAFVADCVDGQLARYTRTFSELGGWLDSVLDRTKEYVVYAGLAIGSAGAPAADGAPADVIWFMATAALALQTFRHFADFSHGAQRRMRGPPAIRHRLDAAGEVPVDAPPAHADTTEPVRTIDVRPGRTAIDTLVTFGRRPSVTWIKRIIVLPVGERFAVISLTAAVWDARVTFAALLMWGMVAAAYATTIRILRPIP